MNLPVAIGQVSPVIAIDSQRGFMNPFRAIMASSLVVLARTGFTLAGVASEATITPVADTAALMPKHGTVSIAPAKRWEDSLAAGNGIMGALLAGDPGNDTLVVNHCKLWLPLGSREIVPDLGTVLLRTRPDRFGCCSLGYGGGHVERSDHCGCFAGYRPGAPSSYGGGQSDRQPRCPNRDPAGCAQTGLPAPAAEGASPCLSRQSSILTGCSPTLHSYHNIPPSPYGPCRRDADHRADPEDPTPR